MGLVDLYYRAFKAFRKHTKDESTSQKLRKVISHSNPLDDFLMSMRYDCDIESDWIENIEEGLIYVEKAIREDRQFIRTEGEVIPIEKVKRVSKTTVEHLAKHSNLITRIPKDSQDLIPEKLYIVEKLNDYLVYENRFLYMLLCYLKDFIQMRLDKIKDKTTTFQTDMSMNKELDESHRRLQYQLSYKGLYKNDPLLMERYKHIPLVDRIENIFALVMALLATPLMKEVSKAPLIKPPVVKTNVLRMNPNFRAALKLYDFVTAYNKLGYTIKEVKKTFNPFTPEMSDEISETIQLTTNIAYITGNEINEDLEQNLIRIERKEKEAKSKKLREELKRLKKRIIEMNEDSSEYILKLEKRNVNLEKDNLELVTEREKNEILTKTIEALEIEKEKLEKHLEELQNKLQEKNNEVIKLNQKYFDDMTFAEKVHQEEMVDLKQSHELEIDHLKEEHASLVEDIKNTHEEEITQLKQDYLHKENELINHYENRYQELIQQHNDEKLAMENSYTEIISNLENRLNELNENIEILNDKITTLIEDHEKTTQNYEFKVETLEAELSRLEDEKKFAHAQYIALKKQQGLLSDDEDFASKEKFKQLELEMNAYKKLFKEQWKKAKSQIRERVKEETFENSKTNTD